MCQIHDAFVGEDEKKHNCLGCNLQDVASHVYWYLECLPSEGAFFNPHYPTSLYLFLLNTLWDRISDILDIIGVPEEYRARHFEPFRRVRRWANFFKHPKEFAWIVHHPSFVFDDSRSFEGRNYSDDQKLYVDDEFVKEFYSCERQKGLRKRLMAARKDVVVILPNVESLTSGVCDCIHKFVELITKNPAYREILDDKCTIENYYDRTCDEHIVRSSPITQ